MDFPGKCVLVTGGSRGIGRAIVEAFTKHGACVAINYKANSQAAHETIDSLPGGPHMVVQADVSQPDTVKYLIEAVISEFGRLDIVVNNAGTSITHRIDEVDFTEWQQAWREILAVNLIGPANVTYYTAQHMMKNGGGRIVNISSRGAFRGEPDKPAYGASKAGLNAMSQSLAQKLAKYNIFIGVVAPGFVETDLSAVTLSGPEGDEIRRQSPLGRVARPEEVATAVLFLASEGTEFVTGAIIDVNGASYLRS
ncbi:MAG: SDR family NAD(P)-dependent oxidoreductase [Candidatus Bipolaricaulia bacterium]